MMWAAAALAACQQQPSGGNNSAQQAAPKLPSVPLPQPPLDRAALFASVAQAASATASGAEMPAALRALDGRQFELRIRFGCRGPSTNLAESWLGWSFDPANRRLRLQARPTISKDEQLIADMGSEQFESVEGFWIPRPWLLEPVCPTTAAVTIPEDPQPANKVATPADRPVVDEPIPRSPRIGIAQFYTSADPRTRRRDMRAYETAKTLDESAPIPSQGFNLVIAGRLRALPGRNVIECMAASADTAPDCIVSVEVQRVRIEQPENGEVVAEWGGG